VQALTTYINLARIPPAQIVIFIEEQARECMTPLRHRKEMVSQKGPTVHFVAKSQSILLRTWTLRPDNAVEPVHHQNRTNRGSLGHCQRCGARVCIDHFQVFCRQL